MNRSSVCSLILVAVLLAACGGGGTSVPDSSSGTAATSIPPAAPTPTGVRAILIELINQVDAHATPEADWTPAELEMTVYNGGQVRAAEASTARLQIEDSLVRVGPNTIFTLGQPAEDQLQINLEEGQIWLNVEGLEEGQQFEVETPGAVAAVRGTRFSVRVEPDQTTVVSVAIGQVDLSGGGQTVTVQQGFQSKVPMGGVPTEPEPIDLFEHLYWGMAHGQNLDMVFPLYGAPTIVTIQGEVVDDPVVFSPDGQYLFAHVYEPAQGDSYHSYLDMQTGQPFATQFPETVYAFAFNPVDGRVAYWAYTGEYQYCVSQLDGSEANCFNPDGYFKRSSWSPDGTTLLYSLVLGSSSSSPRNLIRVSPDGSDLVKLTQLNTGWNQREAWSPDGGQIAYVSSPNGESVGSLWVMDSDGNAQTMLFDNVAGVTPYSTYDAAVDWSPDGGLLAVPTVEGDLALVPLDGSPVTIVDTRPGLEDITWAPGASGWPLFYVSNDPASLYGLYLLEQADSEPVFYADLHYGPYWSADGRYVLVGMKESTGSNNPPYITTFYRFQTSPAFWP